MRTNAVCPKPSLLLRSLLSNATYEVDAVSIISSSTTYSGQTPASRLSGSVMCPPACGDGDIPSQAIAADDTASISGGQLNQTISGLNVGLLHSYDVLLQPYLSSKMASSSMIATSSAMLHKGINYIRPCPSSPPPLASTCSNISDPAFTSCNWGEPPDCVPCPTGGICPGGYFL